MAEHSTLAARKRGRPPQTTFAHVSAPNGEDTAPERMESAPLDPVLNSLSREAERPQLPTRHNAVLSSSKRPGRPPHRPVTYQCHGTVK